jgi:formylglycine-generating enzyme required for sulfatase activity
MENRQRIQVKTIESKSKRMITNRWRLAILLIGTLCLLPVSVWANSAPVVSNVTANQRGDDSKLVDIYYNLADADGDACTVWVAVSNDGGASWTIPASSVSGHWGADISTGTNKYIVWDAGMDIPGVSGIFKIRIYADDGKGGEPMVIVGAGSFPYQNAPEGSWVAVEAFLIGKYEVTVQQYCEFLNAADPDSVHWVSSQEISRSGTAGSYVYSVDPGRGNYPIRYVSYYDAVAYGAWKSSLTGLNYRLPTEQEWEKAAGWDPVLQKLFTYGYHQDTISCNWCNYNNCYGGPLPVGSFNGTGGKNNAYSYYGCYDMSGNLWEWTSSIYSGDSRVIRGGGWNYVATYCTVTYRSYFTPTYRNYYVGFRLVLDLD